MVPFLGCLSSLLPFLPLLHISEEGGHSLVPKVKRRPVCGVPFNSVLSLVQIDHEERSERG